MSPFLERLGKSLPYVSAIIIIYLTSFHSYLFFHTTVEAMGIAIAAGIFMFSWNSKELVKNSYFLFLGIAFLYIGVIDYFHTIAYYGMNIIGISGANTSTQLWIAGRFLYAISFLIAPYFIDHHLPAKRTLIIYFLTTVALLASIFIFQIFPVTFQPDTGLTNFKKISELVITIILAISVIRLTPSSTKMYPQVVMFIKTSLVLAILAEIIFSNYLTVYDFSTIIAHLVRLIGYFYVYMAIIEIGLSQPYQTMFREIQYLNRQKDEFINIASHEIKNPLTNIKLYSQLLQKKLVGNADRKISDHLSQINSQADKINRLINDMLDVSRIQTGKLSLTFTPYRLDRLLKTTVSNIKKISPDHKFLLSSASPVTHLGDQNRISQVLVNLLTNAIKYSPAGTKIIISLSHTRTEARISIQDFGIGIPPDQITHIFEKYYRTAHGEQKASGLGLGLYLAREIIQLHHGRIWVESRVDIGSTFHISLPLT